MRSNLDPFERHSDTDIWAALRRSHLARVVESNPMGLEMVLAEGGAPLSAGQKQLVALARALLRNSKVPSALPVSVVSVSQSQSVPWPCNTFGAKQAYSQYQKQPVCMQ